MEFTGGSRGVNRATRPEKGSGPHHTLHRDLLLPCGFLPVEETPDQGPRLSKARKMDLRNSKARNQQADDSEEDLTDDEEVRRILESLLISQLCLYQCIVCPAADIVKPLGTNAPPEAYLTQLESAFEVVEDGEELFATFLGSNQNSGEKPSVYLNRLQTLLTKAISRGGILPAESDKYLLRQFCRGCWDQSLIIGLQLEHRKTSPPSFPELLLLLRTEEDRRATKMDRMKKHLGSTEAAAHVHTVLSLPVFDEEPIATTPKKPDASSKLKREVAELRKQVAQRKKNSSMKSPPSIFKLVETPAAGRPGAKDLHGRNPVTIPVGYKLCVVGDVRVGKENPNTSFVLEPPESPSLPGRLFLECALMNITCKASSKIPVIFRNTADHSVTLPPKCVIGEISAAQSAVPLNAMQSVATDSQMRSERLAFNLDDSPMPEEWKQRISDQLNSFLEVFAVDELSLGHTTAMKHHIRLQDQTPFKECPRPIHPSDREAIKQHLRELLDAGIIRESESPFASPVVLFIKDAYALPNIEETFSALSGVRWFSVMDLRSGYYQVEMAEEDKPKTAFTCPLGFYEFICMPQGVTNTPSTFQRLMESVLETCI
ncbi:hypothetical protein L3Q82_004447 [Scortum barcoo]|uniref:Uncharacterized protein n=1 Tax=Scortum barcoo TaxID=214431 RepID=A0ACB8VK95_9TELE|nr:hypothetical protein L3Q82_004447 [Scortum barcoo]